MGAITLFPRGEAWEGKNIEAFSDALDVITMKLNDCANAVPVFCIGKAVVLRNKKDIENLATRFTLKVIFPVTTPIHTRCGTLRAGIGLVFEAKDFYFPIMVVDGIGSSDSFFAEVRRWLPAHLIPIFSDSRSTETSKLANLIMPILSQYGFSAYIAIHKPFAAGNRCGEPLGGVSWNDVYQIVFVDGKGQLYDVIEAIQLAANNMKLVYKDNRNA